MKRVWEYFWAFKKIVFRQIGFIEREKNSSKYCNFYEITKLKKIFRLGFLRKNHHSLTENTSPMKISCT